jgi:hypothetical protein
VEGVEAFRKPVRREHPDMPARLELVREVMPERDEVDEVVGVEMAHHDRGQRARLELRGQARKGALAQIEEDRGCRCPDEVGGARGALSVGVGRACAEHVHDEAAGLDPHGSEAYRSDA